MQHESSGASAAAHCEPSPQPPSEAESPVYSSLVARNNVAKARLSHLARAIEADVIPRLVQAHRSASMAANSESSVSLPQSPAQVNDFVQLIIGDNDARTLAAIEAKRLAGMSVEALYLDLFAPAARQLGDMWLDDACDFSTVTVALGRLQRLLRELSPAFGTEVEYPANGRRALFAQPPDEQHSFGLSMVAEFFRREGWDVGGVVGGSADEPAVRASKEWADVVGLSIGSEARLEWLRKCIDAVRLASRNPDVIVMVGGPLFTLNPAWVADVGADATAVDARDAPRVATRLLVTRAVRP